MTVFQFIVNVVIVVLAGVVLTFALSYLTLPFEGLLLLILILIAAFLTFKYNAAAELGV